jgi:hypothetical protein
VFAAARRILSRNKTNDQRVSPLKSPFINLFDVAGVLLILLPLVTFCWLVGTVQIVHVVLVATLLLTALVGVRRG